MKSNGFSVIAILLTNMVVGCAQLTPPRVALAPEAAAPPPPLPLPAVVTPPINEEMRRRCENLLPERLEAIVASVGPMPTDEATVRMARLLDEARPCLDTGYLPLPRYRALLMAVRGLLGAWYEANVHLRSRSLADDASGQRRIEKEQPETAAGKPKGTVAGKPTIISELQGTRNGRLVAEQVIHIKRELARIEPLIREQAVVASGRELVDIPVDRVLGVEAISLAMMEVDAATGVLRNLLDQGERSNDQDAAIKGAVQVFGDALRAEAGLWVTHINSANGLKNASFQPSRQGDLRKDLNPQPIPPIALETRVFLVSSYARAIAMAWGELDLETLRLGIGIPYRDYIQILHGAEFPLQGDSPADFQWAVSVETVRHEGEKYIRFNRLTLPRILQEIMFDNYNLRALFELREAEGEFARLLKPERTKPASDAEIVRAARMLLHGASHTEQAQPKLGAVARAVRVTSIFDGFDGNPEEARGGRSTIPGKQDALKFRQRASRQLAEIALCEMNNAYLGGPQRACTIALELAEQPPVTDATSCSPRPLQSAFQVNGSTIPPITEEAHLAYQSILRALETNWVAPSLESSGPHSGGVRPSSDTICELKTVLHMVALGRLGFDLATYHSIIKMLEDQRVILPPEQMGPLISHAVFIAHDEQRGLCRSVGVDDCSADDLDKARRDAPDNNREAIKAQRKRYCLSVQLGASIVKMAESSKHGVSLLARAQQYLRPLSDADIVAHGRAMKAEEAACFSEK